MPDIGTNYRYTAGIGLAARARIADPDVSDELSSDMADLDLQPGTIVTVAGHDDERGLALVEWTDQSGNPRITSVELDVLAEHFSEE